MIQKENVFMLNQAKSPKDFKLKSMEWAIITQIDGKKSVEEISNTLSLTEEEIQTFFGSLLEKELISLKEDAIVVEYVTPDILAEIEQELTLLVGPVASVILDDTLIDMNADRQTLPKNRIGEFVELVSNEIDDPSKRVKFLELVLPKINQL
jgi:hypothetical protein